MLQSVGNRSSARRRFGVNEMTGQIRQPSPIGGRYPLENVVTDSATYTECSREMTVTVVQVIRSAQVSVAIPM